MINNISQTLCYNRISSAKNALVGPAEYANDYYIQQEDMRANRPALAQIYKAYQNVVLKMAQWILMICYLRCTNC